MFLVSGGIFDLECMNVDPVLPSGVKLRVVTSLPELVEPVGVSPPVPEVGPVPVPDPLLVAPPPVEVLVPSADAVGMPPPAPVPAPVPASVPVPEPADGDGSPLLEPLPGCPFAAPSP
ncbi:hypothetical protein [uncultured Tateyamaria sp.]|uniref:hypothetical protein n=1 Tax=uncultured Tateyamaria sp. TaxID=455651 RepID=UPI0026035534|nr:hypothetical protein [uncultured Tateyamaria sp.]